MFRMPKAAEPLISAFSIAFTRPTFNRAVVLMLGAILSLRHRTVTGMLRAVGPLAQGHWSDFHRVLCRRVWSTWPLAKVLAHLVVELIPPEQRVVCAVDDTNPQHKGKRVYGKGRHHPGAPGSFHAQSYGLGVGTQMGGVSDQCAVSVCPPSLGAAGALRPVSSVPARRETYRKADGIPARRDRFIWPINSWPC